MSSELVPTFSGRPAIIEVEGVKIFISVHDSWFLGEFKRLRQEILDCHPDRRRWTKRSFDNSAKRFKTVTGDHHHHHLCRPDSTTAFLEAQKQLDRFVSKEVEWYAAYGLTPPIEVI